MRKAIEEAKKFVCTTKDRIVKDAKDFVSNVDWDKVAQGAMVVASGALVIAVGVGAIVSTGGLAAPAIAGLLAGSITTTNVMVAGTLAAGVVATGFGASDVIEGIQDLGNGVTENSEKVAFNPIRDTVFKNEPEFYYLTETVVTYGAGAGTQLINSTYGSNTANSNQSSNNTSNKNNTFPENPDDFMPEIERDKITKANGTTSQTIYTSDKLRIRAEEHPLYEGETYNPRHHGVHYHVEYRNDPSLSWNNKNNVNKYYPDGYTPGSGTGFLPGEKYPGSN